MITRDDIRNIGVIAHVDHGKTTLVDTLFRQAGVYAAHMKIQERAMDSNELEREKGITIFAKNAAISWRGVKVNIVDTPGHADFGGEVQRILKMVDGALLLVDAVDGPMPQTKYVLAKALEMGLCPIVVINKIDRRDARPMWVLDQVFELFDTLGANERQLDFTTVYTSAKQGLATMDLSKPGENMTPLLDAIVDRSPAPQVPVGPFQMLVSSAEYSDYLGRMAIGRIHRGSLSLGDTVSRIMKDGKKVDGKVVKLFSYNGMGKSEIEKAEAGEIVVVAGLKDLEIGETLASREAPEALPAMDIDEPTVAMKFMVNTSPLAGKSGEKITSRRLGDRLERETRSNLALRIERSGDGEAFKVSGRGELHLAILIETMRRENLEFAVSRPEIITRVIDGKLMEPEETAVIDVDEAHTGKVMERMGLRKGVLTEMGSAGPGRARLEFSIPARGLIGAHSELMTETRGSATISHVFSQYIPFSGPIDVRRNGSLISQEAGVATAYAIDKLTDRGVFFIQPGQQVYEGMVVGEANKQGDLVVNICKGKKLTNMRAAAADDTMRLAPPRLMSLEQTVEYLGDDELAEITPGELRIRKRQLNEEDRKKSRKQLAAS
ncbi:MAG: translational GTPase TypA [Nitrospinota bacterium]|nr:translational GTPase TypA [Nitrospinota bacterium]MDH5756767.1 translational GTPase TypA [Nitrospinota bacterium]